MDIWALSTFGWRWLALLGTFVYRYLLESLFSALWGLRLGVEWLDLIITLCLTLGGAAWSNPFWKGSPGLETVLGLLALTAPPTAAPGYFFFWWHWFEPIQAQSHVFPPDTPWWLSLPNAFSPCSRNTGLFPLPTGSQAMGWMTGTAALTGWNTPGRCNQPPLWGTWGSLPPHQPPLIPSSSTSMLINPGQMLACGPWTTNAFLIESGGGRLNKNLKSDRPWWKNIYSITGSEVSPLKDTPAS